MELLEYKKVILPFVVLYQIELFKGDMHNAFNKLKENNVIHKKRKVYFSTMINNIDGHYSYNKICTDCYYKNNCQHKRIKTNYMDNEISIGFSQLEIDWDFFKANHTVNNIFLYKHMSFNVFKQLKKHDMLDIFEDHHGKLSFFL